MFFAEYLRRSIAGEVTSTQELSLGLNLQQLQSYYFNNSLICLEAVKGLNPQDDRRNLGYYNAYAEICETLGTMKSSTRALEVLKDRQKIFMTAKKEWLGPTDPYKIAKLAQLIPTLEVFTAEDEIHR